MEGLQFINLVDRIVSHKWYAQITIVANKECSFEAVALI